MSTGERFERAVQIMARLRAPGGCPWDREQTFDTIKPYTLEETYEVLDAIDARDWDELPGELGDLMLQVLFYAEMAQEEKRFGIDDVLDRLCEKLIARHPHVFGDVEAATSKDVLRNWEAIKATERSAKSAAKTEGAADAKPESKLDGISSAMPALMEAYKINTRAANAGFDWPNIEGIFEKLQEETKELQAEVAKMPEPPSPHSRGIAGATGQRLPEGLRERLEDEVGDLLFVLVNVARFLSIDPENALRGTNRKFRSRFQHMEAALHTAGRKIEDVKVEDLEELWVRAKITEGKIDKTA